MFGVREIRVCYVFHEPKNNEEVLFLPEAEKMKWQQAMKEDLLILPRSVK